jgi:cytochrome c peroxidase
MHSIGQSISRPLCSSLLALSLLASLAAAPAPQGPPPPPPTLPPPPPPPAGNPITQSKVLLGKALFWDEQLSSSRTMACGSCHVAARGGSDPRSSPGAPGNRNPGFDHLFGTPDDVIGSPGVSRQLAGGDYELDASFRLQPQVTPRKAPSFINTAYFPLLFWDGRATGTFTDPLTGAVVFPGGAALESQSAAPPVSDVEMAHLGRDWNDVAQRVAQSEPLRLAPTLSPDLQTWLAGRNYLQLFQEAFGSPVVTPVRIAMAIATYERTLISNQAPIDSFLAGNNGALTALEQQGRNLFNGVGSCNVCHAGPLFTNNQFFYTGVRPQNEDLGRFNVTGQNQDRGSFRTPSLRNLELRAPFFHNGAMATIEDVVEFYNRGGDFGAPNKSPLIHPLNLNQGQKDALVAFLERPMTDLRVAQESAPFDHPTLYAPSNLVPSHFGVPTAGSGGFAPVMIALEPPVVGNPRMTIAIDRGLGGRPAVLAIDPVGVPGGTPFQGTTLYLGLSSSLIAHRVPALHGSGAGEGWESWTVTIPNDEALIGTTLYAQWFVFDSAPGRRFATSDAVQWTHF